MIRVAVALIFTVATALPAARAAAQRAPADPLARALDLERRGNYAEAVDAYRTVLTARPGDPSALLGLERSLQPLNRTAEVLAPARAALAVAPGSAVHSVLVRSFTALGQADSARAALERWAAAAPRDVAPYREWGMAALARRDRAGARAAFELGRSRLGRSDLLASEMAQIFGAEANWEAAATEWLTAMKQLPGYWLTAVAALAPVPERSREAVMKIVTRESSPQGRLLRAALTAHWGDPEGGARGLIAALPTERPAAVEALTQFADVVRAIPSAAATRARGIALEELARRSTGLAASRARVESARAYSDGGDREGARRMLGGVVEDTAAGAASVSAAATLIGVLVGDGRVEEAERRLAATRRGMSTDEFQTLNRRVAEGWVRAGQLDRAERTLEVDSTVEGMSLAGRIAIYRGDLAGGVARLRMAGPYAGTREEATERTALLALLQPIEGDTIPELGAALLQLERGDSLAGAAALERLAARMAVAKGGAELRLLAGRVYGAGRRATDAERLFRAAATEEAPATAPAAELELARLLIGLQRNTEAIALLEHLILTYPTSALVPQARRALDEARGAIPKT